MNKLKCAIVTPRFWPVGAVGYPNNMAKALHDAGHEVVVHTVNISADGKVIKNKPSWEGIPVTRWKVYGSVGEFAKIWKPHFKGYDLVHYCGGYRHPHTLSYYFKGDAKCVFSPFYPEKPRESRMQKRMIPFVDKTFGGKMLRNCDLVFAESTKEKEWLQSLGVTKIKIIPNPVREEAFSIYSKTNFRKKFKIPYDKQVVFFLGGHSYIKNVEELIKVAPFVKAIFVIGGEGELTSRYKQLAKQLHVLDRMRFPGSFFGDYEGKMEAFATCDVFVLPSRHEGLGMVLLEAMAQTKPVIASNVGGLPDVVPDDFCLYELGDLKTLAEKINKLLEDSVFAEAIGKKGWKKAGMFSYSEISKKYVKLIEGLFTTN